MASAGPLSGLRVLLVEDEMVVSLEMEALLSDQRCTVVGPFDRLSDAVEAAQTEDLDLAVLDVNIRGEKVYPVAEVLASRGVPFLLVSGYGRNAVPANRPEWRVCSKPFRPKELVDMLTEQINEKRASF